MRIKTNVLRFGVAAMALGLTVLEVALGPLQEVFQKAVRICLECIGIG